MEIPEDRCDEDIIVQAEYDRITAAVCGTLGEDVFEAAAAAVT